MERQIDRILLAACLTASLFIVSLAAAQESAARLENPFNTEEDIAGGEATFKGQCASCHGRDGRGGNAGPDLSTGEFKRTSTDEGLFQIINKGIPGTVMPASPLNARLAWQVVAYIRSLSIARKNQISGVVMAGRKIFESRKCAGCHEANAPDLTRIGSRRTVAELRESILRPQADVPWAWWRLRAVTRDGRTITGLRLNEDTHSIQYRSDSGVLGSLMRSQLASLEFDRKSTMPSFESLTAGELEDLIAFLVRGSQ